MADEWNAAPLEDVVVDIVDRRGITPKKLGATFVPSGYRVISAKAIKDHRVDLSADEPRFVNNVTYRKWMKTPCLADDVILTSEAPLGEPAYVAQDAEWCLGQRLFGIRTDKDKLHGRFLFYALQSEEVRHDLLSRATGTTAQGIRQAELRRVLVPLPPLHQQRAIAHVLGTLDDKIELNRRMNQTLEEMARALFKSWFVDFDPVRAKAALKNHSSLEESRHSPHEPSNHSPHEPSNHSPHGPSNHSPREGESDRRGALAPTSRWGEIRHSYSQQTLALAKALRQRQTDAEGLLWHYLRRKQLGGYKFRRQQPIGPYVVDFACMPEKLVVELHGGQHAERAAHDERRAEFLRSRGFGLVRF